MPGRNLLRQTKLDCTYIKSLCQALSRRVWF